MDAICAQRPDALRALGQMPSCIELQTCLQMARDSGYHPTADATKRKGEGKKAAPAVNVDATDAQRTEVLPRRL